MAESDNISSRYLYKGKILSLRIDTISCPDGQKKTREIIEHEACVAVVPVDQNGDILLVRQYRDALRKELLEIPAGGIDPGESPETAVKRELQEETGFLPEKIEKLRANVVQTPSIDISSTDVRRRLADGEDVRDLLHPDVIEYIRRHGLYRRA